MRNTITGPKIKIKPIQNIYGNGIDYIIGLAMEFFFLVMLDLQIILQKNLQTVDVVSDY